MEKDILERINQDYSDIEKISTRDYSEIAELEKNPIVQRYRYLIGLKESRDLIEYGKRCIVGKIIEKYGHGLIKESNNIWCLLFESETKYIKDIHFEYFDKIDGEKIAVVYRDLEDGSRMIAISKDNQEEFEATHNVVYGNSQISDYSDRYYNTRHKFFEYCITDGQDVAVQKILSRSKNN